MANAGNDIESLRKKLTQFTNLYNQAETEDEELGWIVKIEDVSDQISAIEEADKKRKEEAAAELAAEKEAEAAERRRKKKEAEEKKAAEALAKLAASNKKGYLKV